MSKHGYGKVCTLALLLTLLALAPSALAAQSHLRPLPHAYAHPQDVIDACGNVTVNTTWTAGNVYTAHNCNVIVDPAVTLTIEAGAIVKFGGNCYSTYDNNCAFVVKGTLRTQGTQANPVVITSLSDDEHGGDTNDDGPSVGNPGQWYGLHLMPAGQGDLGHTQVYYAGSGQWGNWDGTSYQSRAQIYVNNAALSLDNSEVAYSPYAGIALYGAETQALIENTHIISNTGQADYAGGIYQHTINMHAAYHNLTMEDNSRDVVALRWDAFTGDVTLDGGPLLPAVSPSVPSGYALTLMPGTLLRVTSGNRLIVSDGAHLTATGTLTQPVVFAAEMDGSTDSNGKWDGIYVNKTGSASFIHTEIRQGGGGYNQPAALWVRSSNVSLQDVDIYHSWNDGVRISHTGTAATLENVTLRDNGRDGLVLNTLTGTVTLNSSAIYGNGRYGIHLDTTILSGEEKPQDQTLTLTGVTVYSNTDAGLDIGSGGSIITLQDTSIADNGGVAIRMHPDNDSPVFTNTTLTGNALNGISIPSGHVEATRHWGAGWPELLYVAENDIYVRNTGALSLEPGLTLRLPVDSYIGVNGSLTALATLEHPIRFLDMQHAPGGWEGIRLQAGSTAQFQHCEIAYGGRDYWGNLAPLLRIDTTGAVSVQDCALHDSWAHGISVGSVDGEHLIRNNRIYNISGTAASKSATDIPLDARYNWWGHASGPYHNTLNPGGQGVTVGANALFSPWLSISPVPPYGVAVEIRGPSRMAPGQTAPHALAYANYLTTTLQNAVLMVRLPALSTYEESDGGIYWPERHQVFWKLGDLAPGAEGQLALRIRYQWGIPDEQVDNAGALLVGANYNAELLDLAPYLAYTPVTATATQPLSQAEWDGYLAANPDLNTLYTQALADGYVWASAEGVSLSSGAVVTQAVMLQLQQQRVRSLHIEDEHARATTFMPNAYTVEETTGGMHWDMVTGEQSFWGDWDLEEGLAWPGTRINPAACTGAGCCLSNCLGKVALNAVVGKKLKVIEPILTAKACYDAYNAKTPEAYLQCAANMREGMIKVNDIPVFGEIAGITECLAQCAGNPTSNDCTDDLVTCEPAWYNIYDWLGVPSKTVWRCQGGCYSSKPEFLPCAFGDCCMPGMGCVSGGAEGSDCKAARFVRAKDPNEKYGPAGDLLPGDWVDYLIEYENVGAGTAYGVFITDYLDEVFDDTTLRIGSNADYYPSARLISWDVGDLPPTGEPGATGAVTMSVRLQDGLPGGTLVTNQAVVYFPSAEEETPTSVVVHVIQPVIAEPQTLTTTYATPVAVTLTGREVSSAPLTYRIVEQPAYGVLSGTLPHLTYTPMADYAGMDRFTFVANNGMMDSNPAQVLITITPEGDAQPPTVLWTLPEDGASIQPMATAVYTDDVGPLYAPGIVLGFSEPLDPTTVHSSTMTLSGIALHVGYDQATHRIMAYPRAPLPAHHAYTVYVTTGVTDLAGNPLATEYTWQFNTGGASPYHYIYLPLVLRQ